MMSIINFIDVEASSFAGIAWPTLFGSPFVSTIAKVGMPKRLASATAMCSFTTSIIKIAAGSRVRSAIEPRLCSSFARSRESMSFSFLERLSKVPSIAILSILPILRTALRIVAKLVSIPPGQRSVT